MDDSSQISLEDKIADETNDFSMDEVDWWSDFERWHEEKFVDEEESFSFEDPSDWDSSSVDSLEDKIRGFMSENEDIWDKYYDDDSSSGEFSMDNMDWWSDFNRWLKEEDYVDKEKSSFDEDFSVEEWDSSSFDSMEDKIREFMSENQDIWDKYYDEDTSSDEFSMENMDWWSDFNRWLIERESVDEVDPLDDSGDEEESHSDEVSLEDMIREFMYENQDKLDEGNEMGSDSDEVSIEEKDWFSEFNRWLVENDKDTSLYIKSEFKDESSDPARHSLTEVSQSSSDQEKSSSSDDSSSRVSSSDVGANFEENGSSSDEPCEKGKGWFKGGIYKPLIITLIVFLAIIACLVIMESKRKRDRGRRSMRIQMLSSGGIANTPAIKYLYKDSKARRVEEKDDGPDYKAFTNLV